MCLGGKDLSASNQSQTMGQGDCGASNHWHQTVHAVSDCVSPSNPQWISDWTSREQDTWLSSQVWMWTQVCSTSERAALWGRQLLERPRGQGWLLETMESRDQLREKERERVGKWGKEIQKEREFVCVCLCFCVTIWEQMHKPVTGETVSKTGYWRDPQGRCLCVSASLHLCMCMQREDLGTCTSLGNCVPRCQKLESLGSRGSYCTDRVSASLLEGPTFHKYIYSH